MIGSLRGRLTLKQAPTVIIECHGVGYELEVPMTTVWSLPDLNNDVILLTHLVVRDDAHLLFGFARMYQSLAEVKDAPSTIEVFRTEEQARKWLGLDGDGA